MVLSNPKAWGSEAVHESASIGILAFETAAIMSQLVSLHRTLSDSEILNLRSETMRSRGVAYLNSTDQAFLLRLACAELVDDLDRTAEAIARLAARCRGAPTVSFDRVYTDLKTGSIDPTRLGLKTAGRSIDKRIKKLDKHVTLTSKLYAEMEILAELEAKERKKWGRLSGPIPMQKASAHVDSLQLDIKSQNHKVRKLKEESLWSQPLDKVVELIARTCYSIFARICVVFGPFVPGLPSVVVSKESSWLFFATPHIRFRARSGPLERERATIKELAIRNSCPIVPTKTTSIVSWSSALEPRPSTVGGAGLALRYANVVVLAERVMMEGEAEAEREEIYELLPVGLRRAVRAKLRECWRERGPMDGGLAGGWKDAVWGILEWLGPVARDTVEWQMERNMDRKQRFESGVRKLKLQTFHFSDREKTEAAIVEVLVGLSLVCWHEEQRRAGGQSCRYF